MFHETRLANIPIDTLVECPIAVHLREDSSIAPQTINHSGIGVGGSSPVDYSLNTHNGNGESAALHTLRLPREANYLVEFAFVRGHVFTIPDLISLHTPYRYRDSPDGAWTKPGQPPGFLACRRCNSSLACRWGHQRTPKDGSTHRLHQSITSSTPYPNTRV